MRWRGRWWRASRPDGLLTAQISAATALLERSSMLDPRTPRAGCAVSAEHRVIEGEFVKFGKHGRAGMAPGATALGLIASVGWQTAPRQGGRAVRPLRGQRLGSSVRSDWPTSPEPSQEHTVAAASATSEVENRSSASMRNGGRPPPPASIWTRPSRARRPGSSRCRHRRGACTATARPPVPARPRARAKTSSAGPPVRSSGDGGRHLDVPAPAAMNRGGRRPGGPVAVDGRSLVFSSPLLALRL